MLSPKKYGACNALNLHLYYNAHRLQGVPCELCFNDHGRKNTLEVYTRSDEYGTGFWYHCPECHFSGTALDYLSQVSGDSFPSVFEHYQEQTGEQVNIPAAYLEDYSDYVKQNNDILARFCDEMSSWSRTYSHVLAEMENLDHYGMSLRYRYGSRSSFESLFHGHVKRYNGSGSRLFRGRNWKKITAIPLYDLPYRVSGFLFINGHNDPCHDWTIRRLGPHHKDRYSFEPGYLCHMAIVDPGNRPSRVIVSKDWHTVLRYQADIAYQEQSFAEIVGWFPFDPATKKNGTYHWDFFKNSGINRVFWFPLEDAVSLREACVSGAMVSHAFYGNGTLQTPEGMPPGAVLRSVMKDAMSWEKSLTWYLDSGDKDKAMEKLRKLDLPRELLENKLAAKATPAIRSLVKEYLDTGTKAEIETVTPSPKQMVDNMTIVSRPEGWFQVFGGKESLISSARCLIDRTLCLGNNEPLYQGRILIQNDCVPFVADRQELEKNAIQFIQQTCLDHQASHLPMVLVSQDKLLRVIRHYANMEVTYVSGGYGWDADKSVMVIPNATLSDGEFISPELRLDFGPFSTIKEDHFEDFTQKDRNVLSAFAKETPYITAFMASMIPPLFSSAYRSETPQTAVVGPGTDLLHQLFQFLDLAYSATGPNASIMKYAGTHKCPYLVRLPSGSSQSRKGKSPAGFWVDALSLYGYGYVASPLAHSLSRMSLGRANMVLLPRHRFYRWLQGKLPPVFLKCMAHCLRHFSRYCIEPDISSDDWNSDLLASAIRFFRETLGLPVDRETVFSGYHDTASYFCDYVQLMVQSEKIILKSSEDGIVLSVSELADCYRSHVGVFDFDRVKGNLTQTMLLKDYDSEKNVFLLEGDLFEGSRRRMDTIYSLYVRK